MLSYELWFVVREHIHSGFTRVISDLSGCGLCSNIKLQHHVIAEMFKTLNKTYSAKDTERLVIHLPLLKSW